MELAQLCYHDFFCDFEVAKGLFGPVEHEEAAADVVKGGHSVD